MIPVKDVMQFVQNRSISLKRTIDLKTGVSVILGCVIGSGIFVSPSAVLLATNSVGLSLILWAASGLVSLLGTFQA
jgi:L-type amino acid transporter 9